MRCVVKPEEISSPLEVGVEILCRKYLRLAAILPCTGGIPAPLRSHIDPAELPCFLME